MKTKKKAVKFTVDVGALADAANLIRKTNAGLVFVAAFNEWMRRYIEEPERFEREFQSVGEFKAAELSGQTPSYGVSCTRYLVQILFELASVKPAKMKRKAAKRRTKR